MDQHCIFCNSKISEQAKKETLSEFSSDFIIEHSGLCLACIISELKIAKGKVYNDLIDLKAAHDYAKQLYHEAYNEYLAAMKEFKSIDYKDNLICLKQRQAEEAKIKKARPAKTSKPAGITQAQMDQIMAALTPEQRTAVLANFKS